MGKRGQKNKKEEDECEESAWGANTMCIPMCVYTNVCRVAVSITFFFAVSKVAVSYHV